MNNELVGNSRRRKAVKPKSCPNPLFEKWLMELKEEAENRDSNLRFSFGKALSSLRKYPVPLKSGKECLILKHFGTRVCTLLDRRLAEYKKEFPDKYMKITSHPSSTIEPEISRADNKPKEKTPKKRKSRKDAVIDVPSKKGQRPYVPSWRSGPFAILLTLHENLNSGDKDYMLKSELQAKAQHLCDSSFTQPDPGSRYTAWSSMSILAKKGLVCRYSSPAKFSLTEEGRKLAEKLKLVSNSPQAFSSFTKVAGSASFVIGMNSPNKLQSTSNTNSPFKSQFASPSRSISSCHTVSSYDGDSLSDSSSIKSSPVKFNSSLKSPLQILESRSPTTSKSPFKMTSIYSSPKSKYAKSDPEFIDLTEDDVPQKTLGHKTADSQTFSGNTISEEVISQVSEVSCKTDSQSSSGTAISFGTVSQSSSTISDGYTDYEQLIFPPDSFEIILLVDTAETTGYRSNTDAIIHDLTKHNTKFEVRHLKVGDFVWICRDKSRNELLLPYIVERKRMDDFAKSIKDGRFHEQKFRLKQCGLQNVIYLVENYGDNSRLGLPLSTVHQAAANTQLIDGFHVKFTNNYQQAVSYLSLMTTFITNLFSKKTLFSCMKKDIATIDIKDDIASLITFKEFSKSSAKARNFRVRDMFLKQLLQLKGLSVEKALAIVNQYPSPRHLISAFQKSDDGDMMLSGIKCGPLLRNIGPTISKALYKLYTNIELS